MPTTPPFSPLPIEGWRPTRDALRAYALVLSRIRSVLSPRQDHFFHLSLYASVRGLTTGPVPGDPVVELTMDLFSHELLIFRDDGQLRRFSFVGLTQQDFCRAVLSDLAQLGVVPEISPEGYAQEEQTAYDRQAAARFWRSLLHLDSVLRRLRATLPGRTGPAQLWAHHFDLSLLWITGNSVPEVDPADVESAAQQMTFGFSTGDDLIPDPYLYATAYPSPDGLSSQPLPAGRWQSDGFTGAVLPYAQALAQTDPGRVMLEFYQAVHVAGARLLHG